MEGYKLSHDDVVKAFRAAKRRKQEWEKHASAKLAKMQQVALEAKMSGYYNID